MSEKIGKLHYWIAVGAIATGCAQVSSTAVSQSAIFTSYQADYSETESQMSLMATFNVGGSTGTYVNLQSPSQVSVNGSPLSESTDIFNQALYESTIDGESPLNHQTFVYIDDSGNTYTNTLVIPAAVAVLNSSGSVLSKSAGVSVGWTSSSALASNESLEATIQVEGTSGASGTPTEASGVAATSGGNGGTIAIDPSELQQLPTGPAALTLCRSQNGSTAEAPGAGGFQSVSYCTAPVSVTLAP
jgi:hypothetical protein